MDTNYTHITILLDRSGSMEAIRDDIIGGYNAFLSAQQESTDKTTMTLVQFDSQDPYEVVYRAIPHMEARPLTRNTYVPRASTPLFDALGRCINDCESMLSGLNSGERPDKVLFVVVTDGQENSSREFSKKQISRQIRDRTADGWEFVFLSADLDAMDEAMSLGVVRDNSLAYDPDSAGTRSAFDALSSNVATYRTRAGDAKSIRFTEQDRAAQKNESRRASDDKPSERR